MAVKVPKGVKLPWGGGRAIAQDPESDTVIVAGESGRLARVDTAAWKAVPLAPVRGFVNSLALGPGGARLAIGVAGAGPSIEVRDTAGVVTATWQTSERNARVAWSPGGNQLLAVLESHAEAETMDLVVYSADGGVVARPAVPGFDSIAAAWLDEDTVLAFARRAQTDSREAHRALRIAVSSGEVHDLGPTAVWDAYARMLPMGPDRALLVTYNWGWALVDGAGKPVVVQERPAIGAACLEPEGFAVASGRKVLRFDADGQPRGTYTAKRTVAALVRARERLLLLSGGSEGALELVEPHQGAVE